MNAAIALYDAYAGGYDAAFENDPVRSCYDALSWDLLQPVLPRAPALVVDAGCGTGRWIARLLAAGYRVIGVEPSPGMQAVLRGRFAGAERLELRQAGFEASLEPGGADAVLAIGSLQYAPDPVAALHAMAGWVRPGGLVGVQVDSMAAVVAELARQGAIGRALSHARSGRGAFRFGGHEAPVRLFDRVSLADALHAAGLSCPQVRGVMVGATAHGRAEAAARIAAGGMREERDWCQVPELADLGRHLVGWGWRRKARDPRSA